MVSKYISRILLLRPVVLHLTVASDVLLRLDVKEMLPDSSARKVTSSMNQASENERPVEEANLAIILPQAVIEGVKTMP